MSINSVIGNEKTREMDFTLITIVVTLFVIITLNYLQTL